MHNNTPIPIYTIYYIESLISDSDDFGEEMIYSQESPKMEEFFRDFDDWDLNRFVEYRSPFTRKIVNPSSSS